jgi:hypothetical protein
MLEQAGLLGLTGDASGAVASPLFKWGRRMAAFPPTATSMVAIWNDRLTSILLKKSEIEVSRKSHFRAESAVSTGGCHSKG